MAPAAKPNSTIGPNLALESGASHPAETARPVAITIP
jgi:hypothetical protein